MTREPAITGLPLPFDLTGRRIFVAGHRGMVGAALVRRLKSERCEVLTADRRLDVLARDQHQIGHFFDHDDDQRQRLAVERFVLELRRVRMQRELLQRRRHSR